MSSNAVVRDMGLDLGSESGEPSASSISREAIAGDLAASIPPRDAASGQGIALVQPPFLPAYLWQTALLLAPCTFSMVLP